MERKGGGREGRGEGWEEGGGGKGVITHPPVQCRFTIEHVIYQYIVQDSFSTCIMLLFMLCCYCSWNGAYLIVLSYC